MKYTTPPILTIVFLLTFFLTGCASSHQFVPPPDMPDDRAPIISPEYRDTFNDFTDFFDKQFTLQAEQFVDLSRHIRTVSGNDKEAYNVDAFGEVRNSSWLTNRNAIQPMSIENIRRGPLTSSPDTDNNWTIIRAKMEGVTAGFTIVDGRGDKYVIKFDPKGYAGLNSGSEVIGSRIFYAAGYNVPENSVCYFKPDILRIGDHVKLTDEKGRKRLMTQDDLKAILASLEYEEDGSIRATSSKYVEGNILGPFKYESTRKDDPNDFIPHQHRRELRGLRVIGAWLNHIDAKAANSMDTYIGEPGEGYVRHYLIDFGTILGSGGRGPQPVYRGHENEMDPKAFIWRILTLGLYVPKWERVPQQVEYPCVGRYYSEYFDPIKFKPIFPNPAYDNLTAEDGYWGAKIVMSFSDEQLRAVVEEAQYPDPEAAKFLLKNLIERRDKTGTYWFNRVTPLDDLELDVLQDNQVIKFEDIAIESGLEDSDGIVYRYTIQQDGQKLVKATEITDRWVPLPDNTHDSVSGLLQIRLQRKRGTDNKWSKPVHIFLQPENQEWQLLGLRRETQ